MTERERAVPAVAGPAPALGDRVRAADGLLVGFDFDGTLVPIAADPDVPTLSAGLSRTLRRLAARENVRVAVVSGRALSDLVDRVGVAGVVYAGNHGLELWRDGRRTVRAGLDRYETALATIAETLRARLAEIPGCHLEDKGLTLTVHVRQTPAERVPAVRDIVSAVVPPEPAFEVAEGKAVFEVKPAVPHDKGTAMAELAGETPAEWLTVYVGDDTTDEDAFEAIQPEGIGIHVGRGETAAAYRIPDRDEVPAFARWLSAVTKPGTEA